MSPGTMPGAAAPDGAAADACWRTIGFAGDRSCAELARHVHCRNCDNYAGAAQRSLQRAVPADYREAWARDLERPQAPPAHTDASAMVFRVGREWLALPMALASEVAPLAPVHRLPHRAKRGLLGVVGVGGRLMPAVALAQLLDSEPGAQGDLHDAAPALGRHAYARLLVLDLDGQRFALPVDEMHGVLRHASAAMRAPAATVERAPQPLLAGVIGDGAIEAGLFDEQRLRARLEALLR